MRDDKVLIN